MILIQKWRRSRAKKASSSGRMIATATAPPSPLTPEQMCDETPPQAAVKKTCCIAWLRGRSVRRRSLRGPCGCAAVASAKPVTAAKVEAPEKHEAGNAMTNQSDEPAAPEVDAPWELEAVDLMTNQPDKSAERVEGPWELEAGDVMPNQPDKLAAAEVDAPVELEAGDVLRSQSDRHDPGRFDGITSARQMQYMLEDTLAMWSVVVEHRINSQYPPNSGSDWTRPF